MQLDTNDLVFIGLGSNVGDGFANLKTAVQLIETTFHTTVTASSVYRSEPVELIEQPWFLNQVVAFTPGLENDPLKILRKLKEIEQQMGRTAGPRYGPRIIDLDLLFYQNWVFECDCLSIPHLKLTNRSFVLQPMIELAPEWRHPRIGLTVTEIFEQQRTELSFCEKVGPAQAS